MPDFTLLKTVSFDYIRSINKLYQLKPVLLLSVLFFIFSKQTEAQVSAFYVGERVEVSWSYSDCNLISYYVIEKSKNGTSFREFLKIPNTRNYSSTFLEVDNNPFKNTSFYRIRYVYHNGNYVYSETIAVKRLSLKKEPNKKLKNFNALNLLVVLKDKSNNEFYVKLNVQENNNELVSETLNERLRNGMYTILASENDEIVGYMLKVINRNPTGLTVDTLNTKFR